MTDSTDGTLDQVTALDEERRRYEGWLTQLDERHGSTPARVLQRVRADYEARLRDVVARLGEHAELLQGTVAKREQLVEELRTAEQEHQDARAEAELRAMVGEYTPEQWRELAARADEELDGLSRRREAAEEELTRLQQVLELAHRGEAIASRGGAADRGAPREEEVASAPTEEWPVPESEPAAPHEVGARGDTVGGATAPPAGASPEGGVTPPHVPSVADWFAEPPPSPATPTAATTGGAGPQAKTLRCQECGTMNYPTEWYCERCGGELATL